MREKMLNVTENHWRVLRCFFAKLQQNSLQLIATCFEFVAPCFFSSYTVVRFTRHGRLVLTGRSLFGLFGLSSARCHL